MPMPTEALSALNQDISAHDQRVTELREAIRFAEQEIAIHEALLDLARNDRLIAAVGELYDDQVMSSKFAVDPQGYCAQEGISLPKGVALNPVDTSGSSARLTAVVRRGDSEVDVAWQRDSGFSARGVPNRVVVFSSTETTLAPGGSTTFPTNPAGKTTTLCARNMNNQQGTVRVNAASKQEDFSTGTGGQEICISRDWAGIIIGVTNMSPINVDVIVRTA